ncbi:MAG TPA: amidase, partial [Burkholderiaceae bacterium]
MDFKDYVACDATRLAELVARREVGAHELLELALTHLRRTQPRINAVCRLMEAEARAQLAAPLPAGPFAGVPFPQAIQVLHAGHGAHIGVLLEEQLVPDALG